MCTATYIPLTPNGFILTHSRDEKAIRPPAQLPQPVRIGDHTVTFPKDPQGHGTWIAASAELTVCLLNGGFVPHQPQPPYQHSRGLVPLHVFTYPTIQAFVDGYDFTGIEPFTLLSLQWNRLTELRWTGQRLFVHDKDPNRSHIWSSVTLYSADVIDRREAWFRDWQLSHPTPAVGDIRLFHQFTGDGDEANALRMNRNNELFTVSLTSVVQHPGQTEMIYEDFGQQTFSHVSIHESVYATA
ncbi:hypothetical protein DYU11_13530 [Fibrisoma montanum]|uniref:NRDE family protein n=1 Tax=Fibrisoma montanum TaxID=2305895 RepID=A0A418MC91_9BACT|nr:NRDE family protein [Fibrisoma montanum]RIV23979.1 hypothetical protein DYU11_13530 [Fibrisoma montanum]